MQQKGPIQPTTHNDRTLPWPAALILPVILFAGLGASYWHVQAPYPEESERFGVGLAGSVQEILNYDLEALGSGWYLNWGLSATPPHPNGVAFMQTVRLNKGVASISHQHLANLVRANPGSVWQIGNEPDSIWMDNSTPEQYARCYGELYPVIKAADPTAQVAIGGMVQATPLRMAYLDRVWDAYQDLYGAEMPVDVWVIHGFILREGRTGWGANIPPGMSSALGMNYQLRDHDDMQIFTEQILRFRQWMADHGQREKPLLVNEYGILIWSDIIDEDGNDFDDQRVIAFMHATFDYFRSATDPSLGYPADDNRLVQAWAWYSLDDNVYSQGQQIGEGYNGDLFSGSPVKTITALGQAYADYVHQEAGIGPGYTDLWPYSLEIGVEGMGLVWGETNTLTLTAEVANHGRLLAQEVQVQFWQGDLGPAGAAIGEIQAAPSVPPRYEGAGTTHVTWTIPISGTHTIWVGIDPQNQVAESDEDNNQRALSLTLDSDLLPTCIFIDPPSPITSDRITITAAALAENSGPVGIPPGAEVWFWMDESTLTEPVFRLPLGSLAASESTEVSASFTITGAGVHTITVLLDPTNAIGESDEDNNRLEKSFLVASSRIFLPLVLCQ